MYVCDQVARIKHNIFSPVPHRKIIYNAHIKTFIRTAAIVCYIQGFYLIYSCRGHDGEGIGIIVYVCVGPVS